MANIKKITHLWNMTALTLYCIIRREADGYLLNDADGSFANAPADPYISMSEDATIKGMYELSESRTVWTDGKYSVVVYRQSGVSPVPASDIVIGGDPMEIKSDTEVVNVNAETIPEVTLAATQGSYAPAKAGDKMNIIDAPNNTALVALAAVLEAAIINEVDGEQVLKAITDKIASVDPTLGELSLSAIASAVRTELATELARIDAAVTSRLAASGYTVSPTADAIGTDAASKILVTPANKIVTDSNGKVTYSNTAPPTVEAIQTDLPKLTDLASIDDFNFPTAASIADAVLEESLADHKSVANSLAKALFETNQRLNSAKVVIDEELGTIKIYDTNGTTLLFTLTKTVAGNIYTITRT